MKKLFYFWTMFFFALTFGLFFIGCQMDVEIPDYGDNGYTFYDKANNKLNFRSGHSLHEDGTKETHWDTGFDIFGDVLSINDFFSGTLNNYSTYEVNITGNLDKDLECAYVDFIWQTGEDSYQRLRIMETIYGVAADTRKISSGTINETFELELLMLNSETFDQSKAFVTFYNYVEVPEDTPNQTLMATISDFSMTITEKKAYTIWTGDFIFSESNATWGDLLTGYYKHTEITGSSFDLQIEKNFQNKPKFAWTKEQLCGYLIGVGFSEENAEAESEWLFSVRHGLIGFRVGDTLRMILK